MLIEKIRNKKKELFINQGKIGRIVDDGDMSGLEILAQRGQWEDCLNMAEKQGPEMLNNYLMKFARIYLTQSQFKETAKVITRYGCPIIQ